jgi:hypothetical protein
MTTVIPFHGKMFEVVVKNQTTEKYPIVAFKYDDEKRTIVPISTLDIPYKYGGNRAILQEDGSVLYDEKRYGSIELFKMNLNNVSELPQVPDAIQQTIEGLKISGFTDFTYDEKTGLSFKSKEGVPINFGPIKSS